VFNCLEEPHHGNDADTAGAIFGPIAGAYYGIAAIPDEWRACIARLDLITSMTDELFAARV
jgi:ADP-ribosylglycohydrolase